MKRILYLMVFISQIQTKVYSQSSAYPIGVSHDSLLYSFIENFNPILWGNKQSEFYIYKPSTYNIASSPILFAYHGIGDNGTGVLNDLIAIADRRGALIVAITFSTHPIRHQVAEYVNGDTINGCSTTGSATKNIKELYKYVLQKEGRNNVPVYMIGFSAGGQFVTRYMYLRQAYPDSIPLKMAVSVNPYYYLFPTDTFNGTPMYYYSGLIVDRNNYQYNCKLDSLFYNFKCPDHIKQYYNENYGVLIGTADTSPLSDNASAMAQGSNRYQRAQTFYNFGLSDAPNYGTTLNWKYREVIGVGHNENQMFNNKNLPTDTFTIAERLLFDTPYNPTTQYTPIADFNSDVNTVSLPNATVTFSNTSYGATGGYEWKFGDGNSSTLTNPVHTYTSAVSTTTYYTNGVLKTIPGEFFNIELKATNASGCSNWDVKRHYIRVLPDMTTNVNELGWNNKGLKIIPNPSNDETIIEVEDVENKKEFNIEIFNYSGQRVQTMSTINNVSYKLNTRDFSSGIYFIKVQYNNEVKKAVLVVQH